ncbi:V-type ATP synthase subunit D, partial [bacterium]
MLLNVNPTRMELLNLKKKLILARRGHKLLKDKLDELIKVFMGLVDEYKNQSKQTNSSLHKSFSSYLVTKSSSLPQELQSVFKIPFKQSEVKVQDEHLVGIKVSNYISNNNDADNFLERFNFLNISKELVNTIDLYKKLFQQMLKLANVNLKITTLG